MANVIAEIATAESSMLAAMNGRNPRVPLPAGAYVVSANGNTMPRLECMDVGGGLGDVFRIATKADFANDNLSAVERALLALKRRAKTQEERDTVRDIARRLHEGLVSEESVIAAARDTVSQIEHARLEEARKQATGAPVALVAEKLMDTTL